MGAPLTPALSDRERVLQRPRSCPVIPAEAGIQEGHSLIPGSPLTPSLSHGERRYRKDLGPGVLYS